MYMTTRLMMSTSSNSTTMTASATVVDLIKARDVLKKNNKRYHAAYIHV